jgi:hypothetical protein
VRKIKYRQKLKDAYVSRYGEVFHYWGYIDGGFVSPVGLNVSSEESEQFTGLQDNSGVDIYEGDILFHKVQGARKVIYPMSESVACFGLVSLSGKKNTLGNSDKLYKVIGNIHENKELLCED